jgi:transcriptional regulator with XRE-family HTH domain
MPLKPTGDAMLSTGNQLKAARALVGVNQQTVAQQAGINVNTVRNMESAGAGQIPGLAASVQAVQRSLEAAGVVFLSDREGGPGVRLQASAGQSAQVAIV